MRVGRIPYVNCYPVYGAIDRGVVALNGTVVTGVPSALNRRMAEGSLDVSVVSAVEYARDARRYLLLPDLAISCDGPVRSVALFSRRPVVELDDRTVLLSASSRTSVALLELLCRDVWKIKPKFAEARAEAQDLKALAALPHEAVLVIGDAALALANSRLYPHRYDLGEEWKRWTGLPFVFAVWAARRTADPAGVQQAHGVLLASRAWGLSHLEFLADTASQSSGVPRAACLEYLGGLNYSLTYKHLAGLADFFRRLAAQGIVPDGSLQFVQVA